MAMNNYRDVSVSADEIGAGFQFEFFCEVCGDTWKTPFKPYRAGQATGLFRRVFYILNEFYRISAVTDMVSKFSRAGGRTVETTGSKAKASALEEAMTLAAQRYEKCGTCRKTVCANCFDERSGQCTECAASAGTPSRGSGGSSATAVCPNCQTASQGGRFCHECGFDMASTHKSCPSCGVTMPREARFCTDCGHGF